jgi:cytochrome c nitrite reductase small subunit
MTSFSQTFKSFKWIWLIFGLAGLVVGLTVYLTYASRVWSYAYDDPAACVNCHVMGASYQSWEKSSHALRATCNDCHVPQDKLIRQYAFKAVDGLYHAAVFTLRAEPPAIRPRQASYEVILENCIRCHSPLVTEFTKMSTDYKTVLNGDQKACWDCHRNVPHTTISGLGSNNKVNMPLPTSPVPAWLDNMIN